MTALETANLIDDYRRAVAEYLLLAEAEQRCGQCEVEWPLEEPYVVGLGRQLVHDLEGGGIDTKELRRFQRAVSTWQPEAASSLWEELELDLEGTALRAQVRRQQKQFVNGKPVADDPPAESTEKQQKCRKPGRPADTDAKKDRALYDAWQTGQYRTFRELAGAFKLRESEVRKAIDRERKRRKK